MTGRKKILLNLIVFGCFSVTTVIAHSSKFGNPHPELLNVRKKRDANFDDNNSNPQKQSNYWIDEAQLILKQKLERQFNIKYAKNVILFLGDGMSIPTVTAARIYKGQLNGNQGEDGNIIFDKFPFVGLSKTYCIDKQTADSACSATAYLGGVKGNYGTIGVNGNVLWNDCPASNNPDNQVDSIMKWAQDAGKSTGIVTTTTVTNASPAGAYAHTSNRNFESDYDISIRNMDANICQDITKQLVLNSTGSKLNVILGGGRKKFLPNNVKDEFGNVGERLDGLNLIKHWKSSKKGSSKYVYDRNGLLSTNYNDTKFLLGLFQPDDLHYHLDSNKMQQPTLAEMTEAAIKTLRKNKDGFVLFVEGGRIDHAHHENLAKKALDETVEFSKAIKIAYDLTNNEDTLIVVTSDHAHTMTISGYADKGNNILGLSSDNSDDGLPYSTLSYANGPGYNNTIQNGIRLNLNTVNLEDNDFKYPVTVPLAVETHGGDDVGIYATGPWSHLFTGVIQQNAIPHLMGFASCIGNGYTFCSKTDDKKL